jgi:hypothetical protein
MTVKERPPSRADGKKGNVCEVKEGQIRAYACVFHLVVDNSEVSPEEKRL